LKPGRFGLWASCLLWPAASSVAHGTDPVAQPMLWTFDPWVVVPLALVAMLYLCGTVRLWCRAEARAGARTRTSAGRAARSLRALLYLAGWLALAGALTSPLHWLGEHLFSFHMLEHELVMAVAAPLLVLARPAGALLWSLPAFVRRRLTGALRSPLWRATWHSLTRPRNATVLHGLAIWAWHVPSLFDAAIADVLLHRMQHLSFLLSALLFWWSVLRRGAGGVAVWHLFVTMVHTGLLGALLAMAPRVLYRLQTAQAPAWGLTPLEDQQLAGIIMWIPAETVYAGAALVMAALWIRGSHLDVTSVPVGSRRPGLLGET
jgi:putative membrane protein